MTVKFKAGAILEQLARMKSGTGRMRDATGLDPADIQRALQKNEVPDDIAKIIVKYVGEGVLLAPEKARKDEPVVAPEKEPVHLAPNDGPAVVPGVVAGQTKDELSEIDITLSVAKIMKKVHDGEWSAEMVRELESQQENPRATLLAQIEALED